MVGQLGAEHDRGGEAEEHGHAPEPRHRGGVHVPVAHGGDRPDDEREPPDQRGRQVRDDRRGQQHHEELAHVRSPSPTASGPPGSVGRCPAQPACGSG
ncbi:hypothetical protein [Ornithinimicrobium kibberense]|uniref:hypothetical protein n=1 Tax=Ornithinimicrobium kibberense TaxID=282060 RepID=UPI0036075FA2